MAVAIGRPQGWGEGVVVAVCLGPFVSFSVGLRRTTFSTTENAFVPKTSVALENDRIYAIYSVKDEGGFHHASKTLYYVVYETEKVDFYRPYLARVPPGADAVESLSLPRCPRCGSYNVEIDADEMVCLNCRAWEFWNFEVVWRPKPFDPRNVVQGEGIHLFNRYVREYSSVAGHLSVLELKRLREEDAKLGNVEAKSIEFVGCIDESHWDAEPACYGFGVYRKYVAKGFEKAFTVKVRELTDEEKVALAGEVKNDFVLLCLAKFMKKEDAVKVILERELYKRFYWHHLKWLDDERVKRKYIEHRLSLIRSAKDLQEAAAIARSLKLELNYEDEETRRVMAELERVLEEERAKRSRWREELREGLSREFRDLPVEVEVDDLSVKVRLKKHVSYRDFERFVETCKKLGFKFDSRSREWRKTVSSINALQA